MMKTTMVTGTVLAIGVAAGLGGCGSMKSARERIVRAPATCQDITIPIYFEPNVAGLTPEGRRVIASQAAQAKRCRVEGVRVLGLADAAGDPAANLELSKQRAASVADAIIKAGLPAAEFDLTAAGQAGSLTAAGQVQPVRRRADITLRLAKPE
jgi:peptidoglycan-associated lipoprotein